MILVSGIHGVGKTSLLESLSQKVVIKKYSASNLIKKYTEKLTKDLYVHEIKKNQLILIDALRGVGKNNSRYLLDGHLCLLNDDKEVERIAEKVFSEIGVNKIILIIDNVESIQVRLTEREKKYYPFDLLDKMQSEEICYSKELAMSLKLPLRILDLSKNSVGDIINEIIYFIIE